MGQQCSHAQSGNAVEEVAVNSEAADQLFAVPEADISLTVCSTAGFGWKRDLPDIRDRVLAFPEERTWNLPRSVDLRPKEHFSIYQQGGLGSCTANAIGAAFHFDQVRQGVRDWTPSRLFIYYNERAMENHVKSDTGAALRDGVKSVNKIGVCPEYMWPYQPTRFTEKPPTGCYLAAKHNRCLEYARVPQSLAHMKACINEGFPFVFGFVIHDSFMTTHVRQTGRVVMPKTSEKRRGGHAVLAVGYDDVAKVFIVRNSWGPTWGDQGYFYLPYDYMTNGHLACDMWALKLVEGAHFPTRSID